MDCTEATDQIELYVLEGMAPEARGRLEAHLSACPHCRLAVEEYRTILAGIRRQANRPGPGPTFLHPPRRIAAADPARTRRNGRRWRATAGLAAAAMVVLGVGLWVVSEQWRGVPASGGPSASAGAGMAELWRYSGAKSQMASAADTVVVHGRNMYLLHTDDAGGRIVCIDTTTGKPHWRSAVASIGYISADASRVYCLAATDSRRTELLALNAGDGRELWREPGPDCKSVWGPCPAVPAGDGRVCWAVGSAVEMFDAATGRRVWKRTIDGERPLTAAVDAGTMCIATAGRLRRVDPRTGRDVWSEPLGDAARPGGRCLLAMARGKVYLARPEGLAQSRLICMDLATRRRVWETSAGTVRHLLAAGGEVCIRDRRVSARDAASGKLLWFRQAEGCGPMTSEAGLIHFVDTAGNGRLLALAPWSGGTVWQIKGIRSCDGFHRVGRAGLIKTSDGVIHGIAMRTR